MYNLMNTNATLDPIQLSDAKANEFPHKLKTF